MGLRLLNNLQRAIACIKDMEREDLEILQGILCERLGIVLPDKDDLSVPGYYRNAGSTPHGFVVGDKVKLKYRRRRGKARRLTSMLGVVTRINYKRAKVSFGTLPDGRDDVWNIPFSEMEKI